MIKSGFGPIARLLEPLDNATGQMNALSTINHAEMNAPGLDRLVKCDCLPRPRRPHTRHSTRRILVGWGASEAFIIRVQDRRMRGAS